MCRLLLLVCVFIAITSEQAEAITENAKPADLRAGAAMVDITPTVFPVIVNGMVEERTADRASFR